MDELRLIRVQVADHIQPVTLDYSTVDTRNAARKPVFKGR